MKRKQRTIGAGLLLLLCTAFVSMLCPNPFAGGGNVRAAPQSATTAAITANAAAAPEVSIAPTAPEASSAPTAAAGASIPPSTSSTPDNTSSMDESIRQFIQALSKDPAFASWSSATWEVYPLGPGTHSWIVQLHDSSDKELGYLVLAATKQGGYLLSEYGLGEHPLFSLETLHHSLMQAGLIPDTVKLKTLRDWIRKDTFSAHTGLILERLYEAPLQAIWHAAAADDSLGQSAYFDAKTGQELPDLAAWRNQLQTTTGIPPDEEADVESSAAELVRFESWEPVDPFEKTAWVHSKALPAPDIETWTKTNEEHKNRLTFMARWFHGKTLYPLGVSGLQEWKGKRVYIALDHDGPRYVPFMQLQRLGGFYPG